MSKWTYNLDTKSDIWVANIFETKEEALKEANSEALERGVDSFRIGIAREVENMGIDADDVLERLQEEMSSEVGEAAEDYLYYVSKEHKEELESKLNEVLFAWQEKYGYKDNFYKITNEEIIEVKQE